MPPASLPTIARDSNQHTALGALIAVCIGWFLLAVAIQLEPLAWPPASLEAARRTLVAAAGVHVFAGVVSAGSAWLGRVALALAAGWLVLAGFCMLSG